MSHRQRNFQLKQDLKQFYRFALYWAVRKSPLPLFIFIGVIALISCSSPWTRLSTNRDHCSSCSPSNSPRSSTRLLSRISQVRHGTTSYFYHAMSWNLAGACDDECIEILLGKTEISLLKSYFLCISLYYSFASIYFSPDGQFVACNLLSEAYRGSGKCWKMFFSKIHVKVHFSW